MSLLDNLDYINDLRGGDSSRQVANRWPVDKATVNRHRKALGQSKPKNPTVDSVSGESESHNPDGSASYTRFSEVAWGFDDYCAFIRSKGQNPDEVTFTWGWTSNPAGGFWNKLNNVRPVVKTGSEAMPSADELLAVLDSWEFVPIPFKARVAETFVVCPSDPQIGKTDWNGGTEETIQRMMESYFRAAEFCAEFGPAEIVIADLGDPIENINNTSSQRGTNDRSLTEQVRVARRVALEGIKLLAPLTPSLVYAAVPSNHGSVRLGPKSPENHVLDDYGIEIAEQLRDVVNNSDKLANVKVVIPEPHHESLSLETSGTVLGMAHGHQVNSPDGLGKWWAGQSHGRMPFATADIGLFGHWHSLRVQQSGDARWLFVSPAQENGSSWFTNKTGERSVTGMLSFTTCDGAWDNLRVL